MSNILKINASWGMRSFSLTVPKSLSTSASSMYASAPTPTPTIKTRLTEDLGIKYPIIQVHCTLGSRFCFFLSYPISTSTYFNF